MAEYFFSENPNPLHLSLFKRFLNEQLDGYEDQGGNTGFVESEDYESLKIIVSSPEFNVNYCDELTEDYARWRCSGWIREDYVFDDHIAKKIISGMNYEPISIYGKWNEWDFPTRKDENFLFNKALDVQNFKAAKIICGAKINLKLINFNDVLCRLPFYHEQLSKNHNSYHHEKMLQMYKMIEALIKKRNRIYLSKLSNFTNYRMRIWVVSRVFQP